ncbi:hypothetical protein B0H19DRAFT_1229396 [Mycena capillaripes]|nr:hypothetical protein B0H19DRAFT_1229396 [Mycena capillaripes]
MFDPAAPPTVTLRLVNFRYSDTAPSFALPVDMSLCAWFLLSKLSVDAAAAQGLKRTGAGASHGVNGMPVYPWNSADGKTGEVELHNNSGLSSKATTLHREWSGETLASQDTPNRLAEFKAWFKTAAAGPFIGSKCSVGARLDTDSALPGWQGIIVDEEAC